MALVSHSPVNSALASIRIMSFSNLRSLALRRASMISSSPWPTSMLIATISCALYLRRSSSMPSVESRPPE